MNLTAMTYNIQSGRDLSRDLNIDHAASVIRAVHPDFVALNEVRSHTQDVGNVNQAWELGRLTGYYPLFGRSIDVSGGEYGNAFLTRLPLVEREVVHIPDPVRQSEKSWYEHRTILRAVLDAGGRRLTVLVSHFGLAPEEARSAVDTVLALLDRTKTPVILLGDFNLRPGDAILRPLMDALADTAGGREAPKTFPSDRPNEKIDYIFVSKDIKVLSLKSKNTQMSDHRPLIARLAL